MPVPSAIYTLAAQLRDECAKAYQDYQESYFALLEAATNGAAVKRESVAIGVTTWDLITHNKVYAKRHGTREASDFMTEQPHLSAREFEAQWLKNWPRLPENQSTVAPVEEGKVSLSTLVDAKEFWSHIMGSGFQSWDWWDALNFVKGDWDTPGVIWVRLTNPDDPTDGVVEKRLDVNDLARAYGEALELNFVGEWDQMDSVEVDALIS